MGVTSIAANLTIGFVVLLISALAILRVDASSGYIPYIVGMGIAIITLLTFIIGLPLLFSGMRPSKLFGRI